MSDAFYLDANALIEAVESRQSQLIAEIGRLRASGLRFVTSELSLAEVLVKPIEEDRSDLVQFYERLNGGSALIDIIPVGRNVLRRSAELRAGIGGKLPDSIHVATAMIASCGVIVSSDKRLRLPDGLRRILPDAIGGIDP